MIRKKAFYSLVEKNGIVGIKKQDGYELKIDGEKFNAYKNTINHSVYILDPRNGMSLLRYDYMDESEGVIEPIDRAKEKLIKSGILKKWKENWAKESYKLTIQIFKAYKKAESLREKQKEVAHREREEEAAGQ